MDMVSDSTLQLTFTTLQLVEFWCCIKEEYLKISEKAIKILLFQLPSCVRLDFFHLFQPKQHTVTDRRQKKYENTAVFLKPDIKEICKNVKQCHPTH